MSLLLDALKRAEESKRAKRGEDAPRIEPTLPPVAAEPSIEPVTANDMAIEAMLPLPERGLSPPPAKVAPEISRGMDSAESFRAAVKPAAAAFAISDPQTSPITRIDAQLVPQSAAAQQIAEQDEANEAAQREAIRNSFSAKKTTERSARVRWLIALNAFIFAAIALGCWYAWQQINRYNPPNVAIAPRANTSRSITTGDAQGVAPASSSVANNPASAAASLASATQAPTPTSAQLSAASSASSNLPNANRTTGQVISKGTADATASNATANAASNEPRPLLPAEVKEPLAALPAKAVTQKSARVKMAQDLKESAAARLPDTRLRLATSIAAVQPSADLVSAYDALRTGDYSTAQQRYQLLIDADPLNIDAEVGLATAAARRGDRNTAVNHFRRALEIDPRNPTAIAGIALLGGQANPASAEVELKTLMSKSPNASALPFSLGNLYASQKRWTEAQQAYFEAFRLDSNNADYVFNLAVSLDQLSQSRLALEYYQSAISLAAKSGGQFEIEAVKKRISQLGATRQP